MGLTEHSHANPLSTDVVSTENLQLMCLYILQLQTDTMESPTLQCRPKHRYFLTMDPLNYFITIANKYNDHSQTHKLNTLHRIIWTLHNFQYSAQISFDGLSSFHCVSIMKCHKNKSVLNDTFMNIKLLRQHICTEFNNYI